MHSTNNNVPKSTENIVPMYRSAFNSEFRNSISYGTGTRYSMNRSTSRRPLFEYYNTSHASKDSPLLTASSSEYDRYEIEDSKKEKAIDSMKEKAIDSKKEKAIDSKQEESTRQCNGYIGFANLPNQIYRNVVRKGFDFTLMVVGASGLGKSTLINSMFLADIYDPTTYPGPTTRGIQNKKTISVEATKVKLRENGVDLTLTLVDTPGFGDSVNNTGCWAPIIEFLEKRYEDFYISESKVDRKPVQDQRVHCCLYFIQPTGHSLKSLDIECMKRLCEKVNIVPIIAKADTLTPEECLAFKIQILRDIEANHIKTYKFPHTSEDDEEYEYNKSLRERMPFAVVGSNTIIEVNGKECRGRKYPWGVVNIADIEHCDFVALRKLLLSINMQDLKDATHHILYENYRYRKLSVPRGEGGNLFKNPVLEFEKERHNNELMLKKIEAELENVLIEQIQKMEKKLKDTEKLLKMRYEVAQKSLKEEAEELEKKQRLLQLEKKAWERDNLNGVNILYRNDLGTKKRYVEGK